MITYYKHLLLLFILFMALFAGSLILGPTGTPNFEVLQEFRLPQSISAIICGACLSLAGLYLQTYFQNPIAGPYVLGISSGSSLGAAFSLFLLQGISSLFLLSLSSFLGALSVALILLLIAKRFKASQTLILSGILISYMASGIVGGLMASSDANKIQAFTFWSFGSFSRPYWNEIILMTAALVPAVFWSYKRSGHFDLLLFGQDFARREGRNIERLRFEMIFFMAVLTGPMTAFCGPILFIGAIVPHIAKAYIKTHEHKKLIPISMMIGGGLCLLSLIIQAPLPFSLPLNALFAPLCGPILLFLLLRSRRKGGF